MQIIDDIPVWGSPVDEGALRQIKTCYHIFGKAAMMSDHHKGYGVPIGGVIAHENLISPSGVGFDIGCFLGKQTVALADGRELSFLELIEEDKAGKANFVYSFDDEGNVVLDKFESPRKTGTTKKLVKVTLDNGAVITSTRTHGFFSLDRRQIPASELQTGESLFPLYLKLYEDVPLEQRAYREKRNRLESYRSVYNPRTGQYDLVHFLADAFNIQFGLDSPENGGIRHHRDFDKLNNAPDNIQRVGWIEHRKIHANMARELVRRGKIGWGAAHKAHPEFYSKMASENMTRLNKDPEFRRKRAAAARKTFQTHPKFVECRKKAGVRGAISFTKYNKSELAKQRTSAAHKRPRKCSHCREMFENVSLLLKHWHALHKTPKQAARTFGKNHKVVSVEFIELKKAVPVYCLTAPRFHNFALAAGVFVHNCGNKAVLTDADASDVRANIAKIMDDVWSTISFGVGRKNKEEVDHELFDSSNDDAWQIAQGANSVAWKLTSLRDMARSQLGTVGSGNHYVDVLEDESGRVWIGVHFGSRGFGHKIATRFLNRAGAKDDMDSAPVALDSRTDEGQDYIAAMKLAGRYAYAGRDWVCERVSRILGSKILDRVHNHHNFAWRETHDGQDLWVVRKGATPAFHGQRGFVGGTLGENSVILEGVENEFSALSMYSTVHGAGRVMGRIEAKGKVDRKTGEVKRAPRVTQSMMDEWVARAKVELRGAGVDESPHCYKRLPEVLAEHAGTVRVLHTLTPIGVAMAGKNEFDPYRD